MAKYVYPAVLEHEDNEYSVYFPDLKGCYTSGKDLKDALEMAEDVLCLTLYDLEEAGKEIPAASDPKSVPCRESDIVSLVFCDTLEYRKFYDNKSIKKTLTVPAWLNAMAERSNVNFSQVLQTGLKAALGIQD